MTALAVATPARPATRIAPKRTGRHKAGAVGNSGKAKKGAVLPPPSDFRFGPQQDVAMKAFANWFKHDTKDQPVFTLFGYAGTGKTTLARHLAAEIDGEVHFAAYTGKASLMLRSSGCPDATTIHSILYKARSLPGGGVRFVLDRDGPLADAALIVIDECSMVDEPMARDLLSFGVPILVLGDPAQLPPVKSSGYFTSVERPDVMLTEIHRQAADNPIIRAATAVREGRPLPYGVFGAVEIGRRGERGPADVVEADQIIVGRNATREAYNGAIRRHLGRTGKLPALGDKLVCLRNDRDLGVFNGGLYEVMRMLSSSEEGMFAMQVRSEDEERATITANVLPECFTGGLEEVAFKKRRSAQEFTYGYALTCHKAQGSQWDHVVVYDESRTFGESARSWLYTAVTRASERLTLIR